MKINRWTSPPGSLALSMGEVQVWMARLDEQNASDFRYLLDHEEQMRAARIKNPVLAGYFIICRGILRCLLGAYLGTTPGDLQFQYGPQGKPALSGGLDRLISFNLSHSGALAVYAFADGLQVGVDIEQEQPLEDLDAMAAITLSSAECNDLKSRTGAEKQALFYKMWTCREALLKMTGSGWTQPARSLTINIGTPDSGPIDVILPDGRLCQLQQFHPARDYSAAVAVSPVRCYRNMQKLESIQKDVP